jgi:hypothetical protein
MTVQNEAVLRIACSDSSGTEGNVSLSTQWRILYIASHGTKESVTLSTLNSTYL